MCGEAQPPRVALPATAAGGPVSGSFEGKPFAAKTAIAVLREDDDNQIKWIDAVDFYPIDGATCQTRRSQTGADSFRASTLGGVSSRRDVKTPQNTQPIYYRAETDSIMSIGFGYGWIKLDSVELSEGGTVKGSLFIQDEDAGRAKFEGTFEATVCPD
jgi:hypothetical protein